MLTMSLVVVVVGYAVNIVRHGERLALRSGGCRRELARLHSIVKSEHSKIKERWQNAVDAVVEEIVQLTLGSHGDTHHSDFHLVFLQGNIITVKIPAMKMFPAVWSTIGLSHAEFISFSRTSAAFASVSRTWVPVYLGNTTQ